MDGAGDVFIADAGNNRVVEVPAGGGAQTTVFSGLTFPTGVAVDGAGDVFIAGNYSSQVVEVPAGGGAQTTVGSGLNRPSGVAVDGAGDVFIADYLANRVVEVNRSTPPTLNFAATDVGSTRGDSPQSVTIQDIGNQPLNAIAPGLAIGANFTQTAGSGAPADCTGSFSLTAGATCDLSISFTPTASGPISSKATLTDNSLNANPATQSIPLSGTGVALSQTITFAPIASQVQGTPVTLSATSNSGLTVSFASITPTVCTVSGTTATLILPGLCSIQASQTGNSQYAAATPVTHSFTVTSAANFTITPIPSAETVYEDRGGVILQLKSVQGFIGNVTLSCTGGPAGTKCVGLPQTVRVRGTALAISGGVLFPKNTKAGTYIVTFTGVSGTLRNSTTVKFTVK